MNLGKLFFAQKYFLLTGPGARDVYGGKDPGFGEAAVQHQLHVPGAFELIEDNLVHLAARVDQGSSQNGQASAALDVPRRSEKLPWELEGSGVDPAAHRFSMAALLAVRGSAAAGGVGG